MNTCTQNYALTISPPKRSDYKSFRNPYAIQYIEDCSFIRSILAYNKIYRYILYPEFDDKQRLHYHGVMTLDYTQKTRVYKHAMHKLQQLGFVDIKPLYTFLDNLRWVIYMKKSFGFTSTVLDISEPQLGSKSAYRIHQKISKLTLQEATATNTRPNDIFSFFNEDQLKYHNTNSS